MAVADPASPSTRVGAKVLAAHASDVLASAASAAITRIMGMPRICVASRRSQRTDHHCPRTPNVYMRSEKVECAGWSGQTR